MTKSFMDEVRYLMKHRNQIISTSQEFGYQHLDSYSIKMAEKLMAIDEALKTTRSLPNNDVTLGELRMAEKIIRIYLP